MNNVALLDLFREAMITYQQVKSKRNPPPHFTDGPIVRQERLAALHVCLLNIMCVLAAPQMPLSWLRPKSSRAAHV